MTTTPFTGWQGMPRRRMLGAALAAGAAVPLAAVVAAGPAWADPGAPAAPAAPGAPAPAPTRLTLPVPTGPHPVGTVQLHLVDRSRPDAIAGPGHFRELMATVWYPARDVERYPVAPWMPAGVLKAFLADAGFSSLVDLAPVTSGHVGAPVRRSGRRLPVLVYSHGAHSHQGDHTVMVQELASHGYAVVTVAHTYDTYTEFPDGRIDVPSGDPKAPTAPRTSPQTSASSSTASSSSPPGAIRTSTAGSCRPGCSAASTPTAWARSAGRRAGPPPPARRSRTSASGPD